MYSVLRLPLMITIGVSAVWGQTNGGLNPGSSGNGMAARLAAASSTTTLTLTGSVKMADGSPLTGSADVRLVCGNSERVVAHTGVLDAFGFQVTTSRDTGVVGVNPALGLAGGSGDAASDVRTLGRTQMVICELRAEMGGYESSTIRLGNATTFDGNDVGVLWLRRVNRRDAGNTVSASTLRAPKNATRDFDKGVGLLLAGNSVAAARNFEAAVRLYPQFAEAWMSLGQAQYGMHSLDAAIVSLQKAMALDPKIAGTWQLLGYIASDRQDWTTAAYYLDQAERLDPLSSPLTWFVCAVAYYQLHRFKDAERSIRTEMKIDPQVRYPRSRYLLGLILIAEDDMDGGAEALQSYLASSPDPGDVTSANGMLDRIRAISAPNLARASK